jgi:PAS domain S-box-containing protein
MVPAYLIESEKDFTRKIIQKETIKNIETIRQRKDGKLIEISLTLSPIIDTSGDVTGICGISRDISEKKRIEKELIRKNQELSRLFFINSVVRSTLELDKLLRIILTVVTMSDGLGFNRAILFLVDEEHNTLKGVMGVGPESHEAAENIWLSLEGKSLETIIEEIENAPLAKDSHLDKLSQNLTITLDRDCILTRCVKEKQPFNIQEARTDPSTPSLIVQLLGTEAYGIVPLVTKDRAIGVILVDNLFTRKGISDNDLQSLMGFTSHIASAIENARLFEDVSLAQSELKNIFESISDMVYYTDKDFNIINVNPAVVKKVGKPAEEIIGKKCYEIFHGKDQPLETCSHAKAIKEEKAFVKEIIEPYLGGTFMISSSPICDSTGNFSGTVNVSRDITELHALRERLNAAERMAALGEMASKVAHEIRNPLISVGGFARRLEKRLEGEPHEHARIIVEEVERLENILKETLSFVKRSKSVKRKVNLNELIENIVHLISPQIVERGNRLVKDLSPSPVITSIDSDRIREAILNIMNNANQATQSGVVTMKTRLEDREVLIEISDTGCGIKQEDLKNIFTPFFTTMPYGTGLGLAITNKIIEEHGGRVVVESVCSEAAKDEDSKEVTRRGTTFKIYLPLDRA